MVEETVGAGKREKDRVKNNAGVSHLMLYLRRYDKVIRRL